jgi:hypothetical protein
MGAASAFWTVGQVITAEFVAMTATTSFAMVFIFDFICISPSGLKKVEREPQ